MEGCLRLNDPLLDLSLARYAGVAVSKNRSSRATVDSDKPLLLMRLRCAATSYEMGCIENSEKGGRFSVATFSQSNDELGCTRSRGWPIDPGFRI